MSEPATRENVIHEDGFRIDAETGEVLDLYDYPANVGAKLANTLGGQPWQPETHDDADWLLEKMSVIDGDILALEARKEALVRHMDAQIAGKRRRRDFLVWRFGPALAEFARRTLESTGNKGRTVHLTHGTVGFRKSRATVQILDMDAAVKWAEANAPDALIVTKKVNKTDIAGVAPETAPWLERHAAEDRFNIDTGVGK